MDGLELDVLRGATDLFAQTEYLIVEATIYDRIYKIMDFLVSYDLVLYDMFDPLYREYDNALWQVDLAFVKKKGNFRSYKGYR